MTATPKSTDGFSGKLGIVVAILLAIVAALYVGSLPGPPGKSETGYAIAASILLGAMIIAFAIVSAARR
jgi:hypothetical protein